MLILDLKSDKTMEVAFQTVEKKCNFNGVLPMNSYLPHDVPTPGCHAHQTRRVDALYSALKFSNAQIE
jgi:hypothetical protein